MSRRSWPDLACGKLRKKREALQLALEGHLREHHCFLLTQLLGLIDEMDEEIAVVEEQIEVQVEHIPGARDALERLDTIPGVSRQIALVIVAEVGVDVSRFPSARHLTAWAGLVPGNNQTGGKQRPARARWGNVYLRRSLVQAARAAAHTKETYLRALYYRLAMRRGKNRAAVAVARTILQIAYYVLQRGTTDNATPFL